MKHRFPRKADEFVARIRPRAAHSANLFFFALLLSLPCISQGIQGSKLSGVVMDSTGAFVPGARITLQGSDGAKRMVKSDAEGKYQAELPPSRTWTLLAYAPGFAPFERKLTHFSSDENIQVNIVLRVAVEHQEITVDSNEGQGAGIQPDENGGAVILSGDTLDALSDDQTELQSELEAIAGPSVGSSGAEFYVDGFSNGTLPPKSSIQEIRINQNPYSAQYDRLGYGRIEIITKPGTDAFHGGFLILGNDSSFNSGNPFVSGVPPYHSTQFGTYLSGPITKHSAFFVSADRSDVDNDAIVSAQVLNAGLAPSALSESIDSPSANTGASFRLDAGLSNNNTLMTRYQLNRSTMTNGGVGQFALPSQALDNMATSQTAQIADTQLLGPRSVNELRFQYQRNRQSQAALSAAPAVSVQGAFTGGGSSAGNAKNHVDQYELQDYFARTFRNHTLKFGGRLRVAHYASDSTAGFNGSFVFSSLTTYALTEQGLLEGLTGEQIRSMGGGADQFSISSGSPAIKLSFADVGLYIEDDWKLRSNIMLSYGLRYETQSAIDDRRDFAPRLGVAWGIGNKKKTVIRGGYGWFYDRFTASNALHAEQMNGINQEPFVVDEPDFFPNVPSTETLSQQTSPSVYRISSRLRAPYLMEVGVSVDRSLSRSVGLSLNWTHARGVDQLLSRNINAPLPGTYNPDDPESGIRPFGGTQNIYEYESEGILRQNQVVANVRVRAGARFSLFGYYALSFAKADAGGANSFPSNQYDLVADYGRTSFDSRHRGVMGSSMSLPHGVRLSPFITLSTGMPFNIVLGEDLNGDGQFNDRPTYATDLSRPSVVRTKWGDFDMSPLAGQKTIPINLGTGPGQFMANLRVAKTFSFGPERRPASGRGATSAPSRSLRPWSLSFDVSAQNVLNHVNLGLPVGTLGSPLFGQSNSISGSSSANRRINLEMSFHF